MNDGVERLKYL